MIARDAAPGSGSASAGLDPRCRPWPQRPGVARVSDAPLPPYRFLPGLAPHPTADPAGHSFARAEEPDAGEAGFRVGVDLYNFGLWWEAHEAWEAVWLAAARGSPRRALLQGLIQVANAQLKLELGQRNAVVRLRRKYGELFARGAGQDMALGFGLAGWRRAVDDYFDARLAQEPLRHEPDSYPAIVLETAGGR